MAYITKGNYNLFDLLSMLQKSIRRGKYMEAGYAAFHLEDRYRNAMWNRLLVISCEDCYGVITKEIVALKKKDDAERDNSNIGNALALMCRAKKSRDACYFACNFVLATRNPRNIAPEHSDVLDFKIRVAAYDDDKETDAIRFMQMSFFEAGEQKLEDRYVDGKRLQIAIKHRDMDMAGYYMDKFRNTNRKFLWGVFFDYAKGLDNILAENEIQALFEADNIVNSKKKEKDEIFISKAAMILFYAEDEEHEDISCCDLVKETGLIDWSKYPIVPIADCAVQRMEIPIWVYDCHTLKGKAMGKTDWDMTRDEQIALTPKRVAYFDDASWAYTYEDDFIHGRISAKMMEPIREYGKTHEANPVKIIPYSE